MDKDGVITCTAGTIGGLTIEGDELSSTYFSIDKDGNITCTGGTIGGLTITADGISTDNFEVDKNGKVTFKSGMIGDDLYVDEKGIKDIDGDFRLNSSEGLKISGVWYFNRQGIVKCKEMDVSNQFKQSSSSGTVGFFGVTPTSRRTVNKITTPSSATTTTVANKVNEIITALKAYGLL